MEQYLRTLTIMMSSYCSAMKYTYASNVTFSSNTRWSIRYTADNYGKFFELVATRLTDESSSTLTFLKIEREKQTPDGHKSVYGINLKTKKKNK